MLRTSVLKQPLIEAEEPVISGKVGTSNVAKYALGQRVKNLGPDKLTGAILEIIPNTPGATTGRGTLVIGPPQAARPAEGSSKMKFAELGLCVKKGVGDV